MNRLKCLCSLVQILNKLAYSTIQKYKGISGSKGWRTFVTRSAINTCADGLNYQKYAIFAECHKKSGLQCHVLAFSF